MPVETNYIHLSGKVQNANNPFSSITQSYEALTSQNLASMNHTTFNSNISGCGNSNISSDLRAVLIVRTAVNVLTCPLIIVLNILVMVAVKTKPQLRTNSNIALACLSTTDLIVGLVVQPIHIAKESSLLRGDIMFCTETIMANTAVTFMCLLASFHHLVLMSAERYVAIKHPFVYETQVTEVRIVMASVLAWVAGIILSYIGLPPSAILIVSETLLLILPIYFNVSVYMEVRRNKIKIAANQVSLEAKKKLLQGKKAFYTTVIVLLVMLLCYIPTNICSVIVISFRERIPTNIRFTALFALTSLPVLNSLFNPLIYAVRIRYFRVSFIQLLSRNTISQAEELEKKIFGTRQIGVNSNVNTGEGNHTLNNEHEPTSRA